MCIWRDKRGVGFVVILAVLFVFCATDVFSVIFYVDPGDGDDSYNGLAPEYFGNSNGPKGTIQGAVDVSSSGDLVMLSSGVYTGDGNVDVLVSGKILNIGCVDNGGQRAVIDCNGSKEDFHRGFYFEGSEGSVLRGINITKGYAERGGGVYCGAGSVVRIEDCNVYFCRSLYEGAGVYNADGGIENCVIEGNMSGVEGFGLYDCDGDIVDCEIVDNSGGIFGCDGNIINCLIEGNTGTGIKDSNGLIECCYISFNLGGVYDLSGDISNCYIRLNESEYPGGGLSLVTGDVRNCEIAFNSSKQSGGGLADCNGPITNCRVLGNSSFEHGGGLSNCVGLVRFCEVIGNTAAGNGGGFCKCGGRIENCLVVWNSSNSGTGLSDCDGGIVNCTIVDNYGAGLSECQGEIANCIIWNDESSLSELFRCDEPSYSCIKDWDQGGINIDNEPMFADRDWCDYHLKSEFGRWDRGDEDWVYDNVTSRCVDAGDPAYYWCDELYPHGQRINMGVYGNTSEASKSGEDYGLAADFNNDHIVSGMDFAMLASSWKENNVQCCKYDLEADESVDGDDLMCFCESWLDSKVVNFTGYGEDFEKVTFNLNDWSFGGNGDWKIDGDIGYESNVCARSGRISHNEESWMELAIEVRQAANKVSFWFKTDTESGYDFLRFLINGENEYAGQEQKWSGLNDWQYVNYWVDSGVKQFRWVYEKDFSGDIGEDRVWVDEIVIYYDGGRR